MPKAYIPKDLRARVAETARYRCGYCLSQEAVIGSPMEIDHGLTPTGRATVVALHLNRATLVRARQAWSHVGWHPPRD